MHLFINRFCDTCQDKFMWKISYHTCTITIACFLNGDVGLVLAIVTKPIHKYNYEFKTLVAIVKSWETKLSGKARGFLAIKINIT